MDAGAGAIQHPRDEADVERYLFEVQAHPDYIEAVDRLSAFPDGMKTSWNEHHGLSGDWTAERRALHRKIIERSLAKGGVAASTVRPQMAIVIGPPGSGKTKVGVPEAERLGVKFVTINADDIKEVLPGYEGWNAAIFHVESAWLAEVKILGAAMDERRHILLDLTGNNADKIAGYVNVAESKGYDVHVVFVSLPAWKSVARAWDRFQSNPFGRTSGVLKPGRFVPPEYVYFDVDNHPRETYEKLKAMAETTSCVMLDTDCPEGSVPDLTVEKRRRR